MLSLAVLLQKRINERHLAIILSLLFTHRK